MDKKRIAEKLIALRGEQSRADVAQRLKISRSALAMYETGERVPRDEIKIRIAELYKTTVESIFFNAK